MQARRGDHFVLGEGHSASHQDPLLAELAYWLILLKVEPGWASAWGPQDPWGHFPDWGRPATETPPHTT